MEPPRKRDTKALDEPTVRYPYPRLLSVADQIELEVDLPGAVGDAFSRRWHRGLKTQRSFARRLTVPPGGGTPIHAVTCDHIIVQLAGESEFRMSGRSFTLGPGDQFYFPANMLYSLHNVTGAEAAFVSVGIEADFGWPAMSDYWMCPAEESR